MFWVDYYQICCDNFKIILIEISLCFHLKNIFLKSTTGFLSQNPNHHLFLHESDNKALNRCNIIDSKFGGGIFKLKFFLIQFDLFFNGRDDCKEICEESFRNLQLRKNHRIILVGFEIKVFLNSNELTYLTLGMHFWTWKALGGCSVLNFI